jgi:hypothetical protein
MGALPNFNLSGGAPSGGVPQWFTKGGDPHSWFPGAPQSNFALQQMMDLWGSQNPQFNSLMGGLDQFGKEQIGVDLSKGRAEATSMADQIAGAVKNPLAGEAMKSFGGGSGIGEDVGFAQGMMATQGPLSKANAAASQVPGQIEAAKQQIQNQYRMGQMKSLKQMIDQISSAAGSDYGYQVAQLGADRGQIALDQAQSNEQAQNWSNLMSFVLNGPVGLMQKMGGMNFGSGGGTGFPSQMGALGDASSSYGGMEGDYGLGAYLQTMGMA